MGWVNSWASFTSQVYNTRLVKCGRSGIINSVVMAEPIIPSDAAQLDPVAVSLVGVGYEELSEQEGGVIGVLDALVELLQSLIPDGRYKLTEIEGEKETNKFEHMKLETIEHDYLGDDDGVEVDQTMMGGYNIELTFGNETGDRVVYLIEVGRSSLVASRSKKYVTITTGLESRGEKLRQVVIQAE